jgi:CheY-like chemotaxis protein
MPKVLLVEDNAENRDALSRRLQRRGYDVILATDGREGVAMVHAEAPDLILLDIRVPEMDGWEVARTLEASEATRDIPVIALTAHAMAGDREKALEVGCDDYHSKPVQFSRLLGQIAALLKGGGAP